MVDSIDSSDVERFSRKVPPDQTDQTQIKDWMDENTPYLPEPARDHLSDRISRNRGDDPGGIGVDPPELEGGIYYDPERERWIGPDGKIISPEDFDGSE